MKDKLTLEEEALLKELEQSLKQDEYGNYIDLEMQRKYEEEREHARKSTEYFGMKYGIWPEIS